MSTATPKNTDKPKGNKALWAMMILTVLASAGTAGFVVYSKSNTPSKVAAEPPVVTQYFKLAPTFVVNLDEPGIQRFLQADVELATRDAATLKSLEQHAPALRNRMILLLGQQTGAKLASRDGKEALQKAALAEITGVLAKEKAAAKVDSVMFTSLVMQ